MCVFCDIVSGKQESDIVFRKKTHVAFLDIAPINEGHILIVPALHVDNLIDLPDNIWMDMTNSARDIIAALSLTYNNKGYTIMQNGYGNCDFGHLHLHVIPRNPDDGFGWVTSEDPREHSMAVVEKIRANLKNIE